MELIYTSGRKENLSSLPHQLGDQVEPPGTVYDALQPATRAGRPYLALNMASTLDGRVTVTTDAAGERIGSDVDQEIMRRLRGRFDAVIRGAGTVRPEPYYPKVPPLYADAREHAGKTRHPLAVVITSSCDLPYDRQFFRYNEAPAPTIVITVTDAPAENVHKAQEVAAVLFAGTGRVDVRRALQLLYEEFGVKSMLSEGGPRLNWDFINLGVLDELFWTISPKVNGNEKDPALIRGPAALNPIPRFELVSVYHHEGELYTRYASSLSGEASS